ncbi:MAG: hypothetical protein ACP5F8_00785 [Candidatus Aenigmatarchaeota archaeon]
MSLDAFIGLKKDSVLICEADKFDNIVQEPELKGKIRTTTIARFYS